MQSLGLISKDPGGSHIKYFSGEIKWPVRDVFLFDELMLKKLHRNLLVEFR